MAKAKKPKEKKTSEGPIVQMFGLRMIKEINPKTKQVHLEIKSKSEGMPMAEAMLLVEGWLKAEKEKMIGPVFKQKKEVK
ncbi:MAG: hypothetical protein KKG59_03025 [Nanoarchaeota archaeon]|nr:hypothetical protein [Nanoarchaeota archaeon]